MPTETLDRAKALERRLISLLAILVLIAIATAYSIARVERLEDQAIERCERSNARTRALRELIALELLEVETAAARARMRAIDADPLLRYNPECPVPPLSGGAP